MTDTKHSKRRAAAIFFLSVALIAATLAGCGPGKAPGGAGGGQAASGAAISGDAIDSSADAATTTGSAQAATAEKTVDIQGIDITITGWVSEKRPDENVTLDKDVSYIEVGLGNDGKQSMGLVRFDLPSGVTPDDLVSARLSMKKKDGDEPTFSAGAADISWGYAIVDWNSLKDKVAFRDGSPVSEKEDGDWYGLDVTDIVREWLGGERANYGFALAGIEKGKVANLWSAFGDDEANFPRLSISYTEGKPSQKYGKYAYHEMPEESGNCLSYALRDKDDIYDADLLTDADKAALKKAHASGTDAVLQYLKGKVGDYIEAHKDKLAIESWRPLSGFDDPIDPEKEYLVEMKIGEGGMDEGEMSAFGDYDYHFRARLDDGRWAEKIPHVRSRITPGSNESFDTGKFPWDSTFQWGNPKWTDYYNSPSLYFAVTKTTDEFTSHMH
ncbi:MAG: DNRLRE domain-containing protein [Clostridiales Family XIII bacterium]|jgi:hypothetical protein|nr:DNRLRE domain-containing protein [Clostridiales Family XIII bacterium]